MNTDLFQTLADPTRLKILEILREGEATVSHLVDKVEIQQSGVSRHLSILHDAGFVQMRPDGQKRLYSIRPAPFRELESWIEKYRVFWEARLDRFAMALDKKQKRKRKFRKDTSK
jgi:DNA-binding transcriptional ArsR family regulator